MPARKITARFVDVATGEQLDEYPERIPNQQVEDLQEREKPPTPPVDESVVNELITLFDDIDKTKEKLEKLEDMRTSKKISDQAYLSYLNRYSAEHQKLVKKASSTAKAVRDAELSRRKESELATAEIEKLEIAYKLGEMDESTYKKRRDDLKERVDGLPKIGDNLLKAGIICLKFEMEQKKQELEDDRLSLDDYEKLRQAWTNEFKDFQAQWLSRKNQLTESINQTGKFLVETKQKLEVLEARSSVGEITEHELERRSVHLRRELEKAERRRAEIEQVINTTDALIESTSNLLK